MSEETQFDTDTATNAAPGGVGAQLRAAREARGLTLDQVAAETRISRRYIEDIEAGNFDDLPGRTYAVGFSRTLAKTVGLDQDDVVAMVRAEVEAEGPRERRMAHNTFEPGDPSRAPGGTLVWFSLFAVVLLLVGIFFAARALFSPAAELPSLLAEDEEAQVVTQDTGDAGDEAVADTPDPTGDVVLTAEGEVWARFSDSQNRVLSEQILQEGDSYTIPAGAEEPTITTARPDLLAITIGGESVPKLSDTMVTLEAAPVSAEALLARRTAPASGAASAPAPEPTSAN